MSRAYGPVCTRDCLRCTWRRCLEESGAYRREETLRIRRDIEAYAKRKKAAGREA